MRDAFPWNTAPRYLLHDRNLIFGHKFVEQVEAMEIKQVSAGSRSAWQRAYVERLIGSIRRECLDHFVVFGDRCLRRTLMAYCGYYHNWRTHLWLAKDVPQSRRIQPAAAQVVEVPEVGGLEQVAALEARIAAMGERSAPITDESKTELMALGDDVRTLWDHPDAPVQLKKRIL